MPRREILGVAAAALSSLLGGTAVAATRFIVASTDPASLALARYGIGSLCLIILLRGALQQPRRVDLIPILSLGVLFFAVFPRLFNKSLAWTAAARGSLALSALPLLTLAVAAALGVERLTVRKFSSVRWPCSALQPHLATSSPHRPRRRLARRSRHGRCRSVWSDLQRAGAALSQAIPSTRFHRLCNARRHRGPCSSERRGRGALEITLPWRDRMGGDSLILT